MISTLLLCVSLPLFASHDPAGHEHGHEHEHSQDKAWKKPTISETPVYVGSGKHRYRWDSEWMKLPEGREWLGSTHGCIVVDKKDRVYLSAETGPAVLVFAEDGTLERSFGEEWKGGLHGLSIVEESDGAEGTREVLYLAHTSKREVIKTTLTGEVLLRIEPPPASTGLYEKPEQYKPTSVAVGPDGTVFVADGYGLSWIHRYDKKGVYLSSFGGRGNKKQHLSTPHGLWLGTNSKQPVLIVADRENHRLVRFDMKGKFLGASDRDSGLLRRPCHVQFLGDVGVVSDLAGRTTLINSRFELLAHLGDNPDESQRANYGVTPDLWREGRFLAPHCARFNSKGELFVMDWNVAGRVTRLVPAPE